MNELHRCGMGTRCKAWKLEDGKRMPAQIDKPVGLCPGCAWWVERTAKGLPHKWLKLELTLGEHRAPHSEKTRRPKPGSRIPLNVTTDELMHRIEDLCTDAAKAAASQRKHALRMYPGISSHQAYRRVRHYAEYVAGSVNDLAEAGDGLALIRKLVDLDRACVRHLGETAQREKLHLPCPACGAQGLVKEVQDRRGHEYHSDDEGGSETPEVIRCTNCDGDWTEAEYKWLSHMVLSEREEREVYEWLLAEARWERDVAQWLAAERKWALDQLAQHLGLPDAETLLGRL